MTGELISVKGANYGQLGTTQAIKNLVAEDLKFETEVRTCIARYAFSDWGDLEPAEAEANEEALVNGDLRLLAKYPTSKGNIYIITECDRSTTTISFCDEHQE